MNRAPHGPHCDHRRRSTRSPKRSRSGLLALRNKVNEKGERLIWLEPNVVDRLGAMRGPGESYSDVILALATSS